MKIQSRLGVTIPEAASSGTDHIAVTVNDGDTVNFTASGTDNQTITAEVKISATAGNIISANVDGIYASASGADNWGSQVIEHDGLSISSGDGTALDPLLVTPLTSVTYAQLAALISGSDLIPGHKYLITDYATVHTIPGTVSVNTGATEPLIVTALAVNELAPVAYSTSYPDDIVYYSPVNSLTIIPGCTKGHIYRRVDTKANVDVSFDYRAVKFRRYLFNVTNTWDIGTTYDRNDVVIHSGNLYISSYNSNLGITPAANSGAWGLLFFTNASYASHSATQLSIGDSSNPVIIPVSTASDVFFFNSANPSTVSDFYFSSGTTNLIEHNTVFLGGNAKSVTINAGSSFFNNTFHTIIYSTIKSAIFSNNLLGYTQNAELIKTDFYDNVTHTINNLSATEMSIIENSMHKISLEFIKTASFSFSKNTIHLDAFSAIIGGNFRSTIFAKPTSQVIRLVADGVASSTNFTTATTIYATYAKDIVLNSAGAYRLKYTDGADTVIYAAVNA